VGPGPAVVRAFVALEIDAESTGRLERIASALRSAAGSPRASWTPPEKMHLTLKFMGALPASAVDPLAAALAPRIARHRPPALGPLALGAFPSPTRAEVVVVHVGDPAGSIAALAREAEDAAADVGIERETRAYRPHLTLARTRARTDARRWLAGGNVEGEGVRPSQVTLFQSRLAPGGAVYAPLARFPFAPR
jgi:2'-5' RNA ligase